MQTAMIEEEAHHLIDTMPEGSTWDNLMYEINFMARVHEGLADAEAGRVITTEELLNRIACTKEKSDAQRSCHCP